MSGSASFHSARNPLKCGEGVAPGGIGALRCFRLQRVGTRHAQTRQRSGPAIPHDRAVIENLLKFRAGSTALSACQICLPAYIRRIETGNIGYDEASALA
jgi:hypothetical protein